MNFTKTPQTIINSTATIGPQTIIEEFTIIGAHAKIGSSCKIHRFIYIDSHVVIGDNVKIQDHVMIPEGVTLENGVFIGPCVAFTNDRNPRSVTADGKLKSGNDWALSPTYVQEGASIGANATIVCGVTLGEWCMVGAGAVVTKDIPAYALAAGNPAKIIGWVDRSGARLEFKHKDNESVHFWSHGEQKTYTIQVDCAAKNLQPDEG